MTSQMSRRKQKEQKRHKRQAAKLRRDARRREPEDKTPERLKYFNYKPPLSSLTQPELLAAFQAAGLEWASKYSDYLPKFQSLLLKTNPLAVLAMASTRLLSPVDAKHDFTDEGEFFLSHLELLQAFILRQRSEEFSPQFVNPQDLAAIMEGVRELGHAFLYKRLAAVSPQSSKEQRGVMMVSEQFRTHTQDVRNDGYSWQMKRMYKGLLRRSMTISGVRLEFPLRVS